ncbi:LANO_0F14928g1_1 [Lachancea nothofagi CBS 11611]|uniref:LANO_0F14928g1_1 n=1 Tax=Lachancea nothofagi CBS 11611 TaxID=1266666 RepID=A0A1G4KCE3_9SACH|nr:LANO_0F14928g1_1 [Lachancea nothofagi CBS 11611]
MITDSKADYSDVLKGLEVGFLRENDDWVNRVTTVNQDDIRSLDGLVKSTEQLVLKYSNPNQSIKSAIQKVFQNVLERYPLLFGYWKRFTAVQYQLNGLESSITVLSHAVDAFPHSLELWCDYLNVLMANNPDKVDQIRINFQIARNLVGFQFLSHSFWDKYIEFENEQGQVDHLADIYKVISRIPLHQYSRYYTAYKEFGQKNSATVQVDEDIDKIFATTQQLVNSVWKYESQISQSFFNLGPLAQKELDNWDQYLSFAAESELVSVELTKSIYQRCLIPCRYYEHFWLRYTRWMESNCDLTSTLEIYERGAAVVPLEQRALRQNYLSFLKKSLRNNKEKVFDIYLLTLAEFSRLYPKDSSFVKDFLITIKKCEFGSNLTQADREILAQQNAYASYLEANVRTYIRKAQRGDTRLQQILNDSSFPVLAIELIKVTQLTLKNTIKTRAYFSEFEKLPQIKNNTSFWLTFYKFLKTTVDLNGLENFVFRLGTEIQIPVVILNDIISDFKSFFLTNVNIDAYEKNVFDGRYKMTIDPLIDLEYKVNNPFWSKPGITLGIESQKKDIKDNGHPGLYLDKPLISNTIIEHDSKAFASGPPPLPVFKNLEKINKPAVHKDYFTRDFMNTT